MSSGWAGHILRIDLSARKSSIEPVAPYTGAFVGGRGISVKMLFDEVDPHLSPLDPENRLFFGPGVLSGTPAPGSDRLKVTALAAGGFLRNAGLGGNVPAAIKSAGYDLIVVQGRADRPVYVYINDDSVSFRDAGHLRGKDTYETQQLIKDELGQTVDVLCIGPAGEHEVMFGSIHTGLTSAAGRCGFGGIMGSKNLKAIAVAGTRPVAIAQPEEFLRVAEEQKKFYENKDARTILQTGPDRWIAWGFQEFGTGPRGNFEPCDWAPMYITQMDDFAAEFGRGEEACGKCPISHYAIYEVPGIGRGGAKCTGLYSVTGTLWNSDWKLGFRAYNLINRYGLDVMSTASSIAFLMELYEKGVITERDTDGIPMKKGDENAIISAIHKIGKQEGFGRLFKDGVAGAAKLIGRGAEEYAMTTKGLELQPFEYRAIKQSALAAATNTKDVIDAVNLVWYDWEAAPDQESKKAIEKKAEELYGSREAAFPESYTGAVVSTVVDEGKTAAVDMAGVCKWLIPWFLTESLEVPARLLSLVTGVEMSEADLLEAAQRVVTLERAFNVMGGMRRRDDTLPKRLFEEPVPSGPVKGSRLDKAKFDKMLDGYYVLRGYDADGVPTQETFKKYGLTSEWKVFEKNVPRVRRE